MKKLLFALLFAALPVCLYAQTDTVNVPSDLNSGTEGNLNNAIAAVINADSVNHTSKFSNTVFKLEPYGYYILTATITTPPHSHFYLVGPAPGFTQATSLPQIAWTTSGGVSTTFNFDCYGDVTMKNVWLLYANANGGQSGSSLVLEDDSLADLSGKGEVGQFDDCVIDYADIGNGGGSVEPACKHFHGTFTNCYWRNCADNHYRYYGRAVSWTYQSTTWHTDSLTFENCTFANMGYTYMQESPEYADYVSFNHCTFLNEMMYTLESSYWWNLAVTNCVFVNSFLYGDIPGSAASLSPNGGSNTPNGGSVNIDSVSTLTFTVPFTDSSTAAPNLQRHILFANCSYGFEKWYTDFLANDSYNNSVADSEKAYMMPMMSAKTDTFFETINGVKRFPYINKMNLYPADDTSRNVADYLAEDPGFVLPPDNKDSIEAFLIGRWQSGANVNWAYDPTSDVQQVWPFNEDLSYSNSTLETAAMGNFPLGDLYRWWPTEYTSWKAQANVEHATISDLLDNGTKAVKERPGTLPAEYKLSQNYPNPFNPTTQIEYSIPKNGFVTLKVFNILGQEVATLFSGAQHAGNFTATFDGSKFASGVYFYRLQAGNVSITKKLVFMK